MAAEVIPTNVRASPRRRLPIEAIQAWLFLLPAVVILGVFQIFPAIAAFSMSLFKWDVVQGAFRGFGNYTDWLYDNSIRSPDFWRSLSTTFTFVIFTVPLEIALSLVLAYLLFQKMRGRGIYRTVYYLPYVTSFVAAAAIFFWVFHPTYGLVNDLVGVFGIGPQRWLDEPNGIFELAASAIGVTVPAFLAGPSLALVVLSLVTIWHFLGYQIVIFLAGLSNISQEYYEAARLDGASEFQIFRKIVLPLIKPAIVVLGIFTFMMQWVNFLWPLVITTTDPMKTLTVGIASLQGQFVTDWGVISAAAVMTMGPVIVIFLIFQRWFVQASMAGALKQ